MNKRRMEESVNKDSMEPQKCKHPLLLLAKPDLNAKVPLPIRQGTLGTLYKYIQSNKSYADPEESSRKIEQEIYMQSSSKEIYKHKAACRISNLKSGCSPADVVTSTQEVEKLVPYQALNTLKLSDIQLAHLQFPREGICKLKPQDEQTCQRCGTKFTWNPYSQNFCRFHPKKLVKGKSERVYLCCNGPKSSLPCSTAPRHVFSFQSLAELFYIKQFWKLNDEKKAKHLDFVCLDCEMLYTSVGLEIGRVSIIDWNENIVLDILIRPEGKIIDFNTTYSGISENSFENFENIVDGVLYSVGSMGLKELRNFMSDRLGQATIITGFAVQNDIRALNVLFILTKAHT